jgi:hypothetical protein
MTKKNKKPKKVVLDAVSPVEVAVEQLTSTVIPVVEPETNTETVASDTVTLKVRCGTLHFEQGTFKKGETFTVPKERAARFDKNSVETVQ